MIYVRRLFSFFENGSCSKRKARTPSIGIALVFSFFIGLDQIADDFQDRSFLSIQNASWGL
jgi:hypothetical protein